MKYCCHCGKEVMDEAIICPSCGCSVQYGNMSSQQPGQAKNTEGHTSMSVIGFVFAFLVSFVGLIVSIMAYGEAKRLGNERSQSLSRAGIIVSAVLLALRAVLYIVVFVLIIVDISSYTYGLSMMSL